jgi:L-threonylcarbamoyladenylate synthase
VTSIHVDPLTCLADDVTRAIDWLHAGGIVAVPTDTFYGLAVDPTSAPAVRDVFDLKGRDPGAQLPLIAASQAQVEAFCRPLGALEARLASCFWPGPLSLVVDAPAAVATGVHGGGGTMAIRVPAHRVARVLCDAWGGPLTATSANRSGEPPAIAVEVLAPLAADGRVLVIDAGKTRGGSPSTIVDARGHVPVLIRAGAIAWTRVLESIEE